jgi:hypothetical protein
MTNRRMSSFKMFVILVCQILIKLEISQRILDKYSYTKFNENQSSDSLVIPCAQTDRQTDRRTDGQT